MIWIGPTCHNKSALCTSWCLSKSQMVWKVSDAKEAVAMLDIPACAFYKILTELRSACRNSTVRGCMWSMLNVFKNTQKDPKPFGDVFMCGDPWMYTGVPKHPEEHAVVLTRVWYDTRTLMYSDGLKTCSYIYIPGGIFKYYVSARSQTWTHFRLSECAYAVVRTFRCVRHAGTYTHKYWKATL